MNSPRPNPPETLSNATGTEAQRYRFKPAVADGISLPAELHGMVAVRAWKLIPGIYLASCFTPRRYSSNFFWADQVPAAVNSCGIYAHNLLNHRQVVNGFGGALALGIVELTGRVIEHANHVFRAECCRILQLVAHSTLAARLSMVYGVPCVIADSDEEAGRKMVNWLGEHDGIRCLQWNLQLPADLEAEKLLSSVESLGSGYAETDSSIPEEEKDRGSWLSEYKDDDEIHCPGGVAIFKNSAVETKYPGGMKSLTSNFPCLYNSRITVIRDGCTSGMVAALIGNPAKKFKCGSDYVVLDGYNRAVPMTAQERSAMRSWLVLSETHKIRSVKDGS